MKRFMALMIALGFCAAIGCTKMSTEPAKEPAQQEEQSEEMAPPPPPPPAKAAPAEGAETEGETGE